MLNRLFVLGLAVTVISLVSPCHAGLDPNADVEFHHVGDPIPKDLDGFLTKQITDARQQVYKAVYGEPPGPDAPNLNDYYADTHTKVFQNLGAGSTGILALDQFDQTRILPATGNQVPPLQGVLLYLTVRLKGGRLVLDNETQQEITKAVLQIGANLNVKRLDLNVDFSASPFKESSLKPDEVLAKDVNVDGTDPFDGKRPNAKWSDAVLDQYCQGLDKLVAKIDPDDPKNFFDYGPIFTVGDYPDQLKLFVGDGEIGLPYGSETYGSAKFSPSQVVNCWPSRVTFDLEARVVYLYALPEPASMGLLAAALVPVLLRRGRKRKTRLS